MAYFGVMFWSINTYFKYLKLILNTLGLIVQSPSNNQSVLEDRNHGGSKTPATGSAGTFRERVRIAFSSAAARVQHTFYRDALNFGKVSRRVMKENGSHLEGESNDSIVNFKLHFRTIFVNVYKLRHINFFFSFKLK